MDPSFSLTSVDAAIGFFMLLLTIFFLIYRKIEFHQENKIIVASSTSSLSLSFPTPSSSSNGKHDVFPSFHGKDVRRTILTHILKEMRRKGIDPFIDNDIERSKSISPELVQAIRGSKISIVLLSRNYASSSWCLNELVEIMKCRKVLGQIVMTIFYEVDPTDVKKQTREFGKVFKKTCRGKTKEDIESWRHALTEVAQIAGYDSRNWNDEATMIEQIAIDVSNMLNNFIPSRYFDRYVGMEAHMERMNMFLRLDLDEVRMIGIWGPSGIGKSTIARFLFDQISPQFQLKTIMADIKGCYPRPCFDEYNAKLQLQNQMLSQIINQKDIIIPSLDVAQERLKDKKVLLILDDVDRLAQLDSLAKDIRWFGPRSRIIIKTEDMGILKAHDINHIYKVNFPSTNEAFQIFCMHAFGQKSPKAGFKNLALEVTYLAGKLPLGLKVMGSYFRKMSKKEWINSLPLLRNNLDGEIESILKFSYDALCDEYKDLFLHIACLFNLEFIERVVRCLEHKFYNIRQGLQVLVDKSLISFSEHGWIVIMHDLLIQLGRKIVKHKPGHESIREPEKRQFLVHSADISEVLSDNTGSKSVIGIHLRSYELLEELNISESAFEAMSNLKFLRFRGSNKLYLPHGGLNYISRKLRLLEWDFFPMTCLPSNFCTKYLVELSMRDSKLQKLWEGIQPLGNLKQMDLSDSKNLKELPDLSTASNLILCYLNGCTSLVELPSSIGNATNLKSLYLTGCSGLVKLPPSIGNATNLQCLYLVNCSSLVELPYSIGNLHKLKELNLEGCSKLEVLPTDINLESLYKLDLTDCLLLKSFPKISTNIKVLKLMGTAIKEVPPWIKLWSRLCDLEMTYNENLEKFPHALDIITKLCVNNTEMQDIPLWVQKSSCLLELKLVGCKNLVSLPQLSNSLLYLEAENCESLERLDCSFQNPKMSLRFFNCFKLNEEARDRIIQTSTNYAVLPGKEVPVNFIYRANTGSSIKINLNQRPLCTTSRFKACILLVNRSGMEEQANVRELSNDTRIHFECGDINHQVT